MFCTLTLFGNMHTWKWRSNYYSDILSNQAAQRMHQAQQKLTCTWANVRIHIIQQMPVGSDIMTRPSDSIVLTAVVETKTTKLVMAVNNKEQMRDNVAKTKEVSSKFAANMFCGLTLFATSWSEMTNNYHTVPFSSQAAQRKHQAH